MKQTTPQPPLNRHQRGIPQGNYSLSGLVGRQAFGKTVGVLGTGAIGAEACRIFKGIGMEVLAYDVRPNPKVRRFDRVWPRIPAIRRPLPNAAQHERATPTSPQPKRNPNIDINPIRALKQVEAMGIKYHSWEDILPRADIVSLHLPLLPATKYFIDVSVCMCTRVCAAF